jgi:putative aminopeptidase FrvX
LTLVFSVPTRYIHSHQSVIDVRDYEAAVKLITALCEQLDQQTYAKLLEA